MAGFDVTIPTGSIEMDDLMTEADFEREAERLLPAAIDRIAVDAAELAWRMGGKKLQRMGESLGEQALTRRRFVELQAKEYVRTLKTSDRLAIRDIIIAKLKMAARQTS